MAGRVQFKSGNIQGATSIALTFTTTPTVGNTVIVLVSDFNDGHVTGSSVTDNQGNTYTADLQYSGTANGPGSNQIFSAPIGTASGTFTVTYHTNGGNWFVVATIIEVNGLTATPRDIHFSSDLPITGSAYSTNTPQTTIQADEYLIGLNHARNTTTAFTPDTPWVAVVNNSDGSFQSQGIQDQVVHAIAGYVESGTFTGGGPSSSHIVGYKLATTTFPDESWVPKYPDQIRRLAPVLEGQSLLPLFPTLPAPPLALWTPVQEVAGAAVDQILPSGSQ